MSKQFKDKYLVKYEKNPNKSFRKFEIIPLSVIDISNPEDYFFKNDVLVALKCYEHVKDSVRNGQNKDGELVIDGHFYWLQVECAGIKYANDIFWKKFDDINGQKS